MRGTYHNKKEKKQKLICMVILCVASDSADRLRRWYTRFGGQPAFQLKQMALNECAIHRARERDRRSATWLMIKTV